MADGTKSTTFCEGVEVVDWRGKKVALKKRPLSKCLDDPKEASPKRLKLSSKNATTPHLSGPVHSETTLREPRENGRSLEQGFEEVVHSLVSKAVFSLDGDTEISNLLDAFQSALEKKIDSGAIRVKNEAKIKNLEQLKGHIKNSLASTLKPSATLGELDSELMGLKREAAAWAELAENQNDLVGVMAESEAQNGGDGGNPERVPGEGNEGMQVFERLAEIGQAVKLKEMELARLQECTDAARLQASEISTKLLEMRNEKEFYSLLPDQKLIDMFKALLEV